MVLFMKMFVEPILKGRKTQTRRLWKKPMMKVGGIYKAKTSRYSRDYFCKIGCTRLFQQRLRDISLTDVYKEGFKDYDEFCDGFLKINSHKLEPQDTNPMVWVVEFLVVSITRKTEDGIIDYPIPNMILFEQYTDTIKKETYR